MIISIPLTTEYIIHIVRWLGRHLLPVDPQPHPIGPVDLHSAARHPSPPHSRIGMSNPGSGKRMPNWQSVQCYCITFRLPANQIRPYMRMYVCLLDTKIKYRTRTTIKTSVTLLAAAWDWAHTQSRTWPKCQPG